MGSSGSEATEELAPLEEELQARNSLRASDARQNINLDPLEAYLSQLDNRLTALENGTDDGTDLPETVEQLEDQIKTFGWSLVDFQDSREEMEGKVGELTARLQALERAKPKPLKKLSMIGTVGASSNYDTYWNQDRAFNTTQHDNWCSGSGSWPASIWMKFKQPHRLAKIAYAPYHSPKNKVTLEVIGSQDCDKNHWTTLLQVDNPMLISNVPKRLLMPSTTMHESFSCIGLRFTKKESFDYDYV